MLIDKLKMTGKLSIELRGPDGELKHSQEIDNLVVTVGKNFIASRIKDATATAMSHMAIGTGVGAAAVGDTTLGAEAARVALTSTTVTGNNVAYVANFPAGTGTGAITEAGLFNAASAGTLLCRTVFAVVSKAAADSLGITWTVTVN